MLKQIINGKRVIVSTASLQADAAPARNSKPTRAATFSVAAMPKITRVEQDAARNAAAIIDLQNAGGIVARGAWQTGSGNYKKARAVPEGAQEFTSYDRSAPASVVAWFAAHPRAQRCVAVVQAVAA
jgi:hypothetical protein